MTRLEEIKRDIKRGAVIWGVADIIYLLSLLTEARKALEKSVCRHCSLTPGSPACAGEPSCEYGPTLAKLKGE